MQDDARKAAVAAYRERKVHCGIYAIRCLPSQQLWVGSAPDLASIQNRLWFALRSGNGPHPTLQHAWAAHGEAAFRLETLERWASDDIGHARNRMLKAGRDRWADQLRAIPL